VGWRPSHQPEPPHRHKRATQLRQAEAAEEGAEHETEATAEAAMPEEEAAQGRPQYKLSSVIPKE
jgi:hypothetical protein